MELNENLKNKVKDDENKCINCKLCFHNCPMMKEFENSPKDLMNRILSDSIDIRKVAYSCMLCGLCTSKCPKGINLKSTFYKIRKYAVLNNKQEVKRDGYKVVRFHQMNSFSPIFSKSLKINDNKTVFLPGCSLSSYSEDIVLKTYEYLKQYYTNIGMTLKCCGKPTLSMGDEDKFKKYYSSLETYIKKEGIDEIIVACPNCYNTIKNYSKNVKIKTVYEVINEIGVPDNLKHNYEGIEAAIHDSCSTRHENQIHESVRWILRELGLNIVEFKNNKKDTVCCGAGGMVGVTNYKLALKQMNSRADETKCENIVCYCESCCESLLNSNKNILHILDLLFNEEVINKNLFTQSKTKTLNKWITRYKTTTLCK